MVAQASLLVPFRMAERDHLVICIFPSDWHVLQPVHKQGRLCHRIFWLWLRHSRLSRGYAESSVLSRPSFPLFFMAPLRLRDPQPPLPPSALC
jgi:hypothetical protein